MLKRLLHNRIAVGTIGVVLLVALIGIFAPVVAPNDPYETNILNKFAEYSGPVDQKKSGLKVDIFSPDF